MQCTFADHENIAAPDISLTTSLFDEEPAE